MVVARPSLPLGFAVLLGFAARPVTAGAGLIVCVACFSEFCPALSALCAVTGVANPLLAAACIALTCAPCGLVCAPAAISCFDESTMIETRDGHMPIAEVKKNDLVLGVDDRYSLVTENLFVEGPVEMVRFEFAAPETHLATTANHWHYTLSDDGSLVPIQASEISVGMIMFLHSKTNATVSAVSTFQTSGRWSLSTESCSVFANGVLSGAICANPRAPLFVYQLAKLNVSADSVSAVLRA